MNKVYQQCGHNTNWNLDSFRKDNCGDGLIFSPVHYAINRLEEVENSIRQVSLFDPQYYLPSSQKKKLQSYSFFPDLITKGFRTKDFSIVALDSARQCIEFQIKNDFESILIPARYIGQMESDYIRTQEEFSLLPFLHAASESKANKALYFTLPLTIHMIKDTAYRTKLLNWVTSYPEITGVYVFVATDVDEKQISSETSLAASLDFFRELRMADLEVIIGYTNTESILYSIVDGCDQTIGTFENTRMFSIDKFLVHDEDRRGPAPRIYIPKLLNHVRFNVAQRIRRDKPDLWERIYTPTDYSEQEFRTTVDPHFTQPNLYKHHLILYSEQLKQWKALDARTRYTEIRQAILNAMEFYKQIIAIPQDLDSTDDGEHLTAWRDSLNSFYARHLKG